MTADIIYLQNKQGKHQYPVTSSEAVGMSDGSGSLDDKLSTLSSKADCDTHYYKEIAKIQALNPIYEVIQNQVYGGETGDIADFEGAFRVEPIEILVEQGTQVAWVGAVPRYTLFYKDATPCKKNFLSSVADSAVVIVPPEAKYMTAYFRKDANPSFSKLILYQPVDEWKRYFNIIKEAKINGKMKSGDLYFNYGYTKKNQAILIVGNGNSIITVDLCDNSTYYINNHPFIFNKDKGLLSLLFNYVETYPYSLNGEYGTSSYSDIRKSTGFIRNSDILKIKVKSSKYKIAQILYYDSVEKPSKFIITNVDELEPISDYKFFRVQIKKANDEKFLDTDTNELELVTLTGKHITNINQTVGNLTERVTIIENNLDSIVGNFKIDFNGVGYIDKNGITHNDTNWMYSDFYDLSPISNIYAYLKGSSSGNVALVSYYTNQDKSSLIDTYTSLEIQENIVIPKEAKFVRFCGQTAKNGRYEPQVTISIDKVSKLNEEFVEVNTKLSGMLEEYSLINGDLELGLLDLDGKEVFNGDANWNRTGYIAVGRISLIKYLFYSSGSPKAAFVFYDGIGGKVLGNIPMSDQSKIEGTIDKFPEGTKFFRASFSSAKHNKYTPILDITALKGDAKEVVEDTLIYPKNIYLVCNDSIPNSVYQRNTSPVIYLDHCFKNLNKEMDIRFSDGGVKQAIGFKTKSDFNWNCVLNNDKNIDTFPIQYKVVGNNAPEGMKFSVNVISTKASISKSKKPLVLVVGSSTVYGEGATYTTNGMTNVKPYHAICTEFFKKDNIDQGGGNEIVTLGTIKHAGLTFKYKDQVYTYDDYCEGYRGEKIEGFMKFPKFTNENGEFSFAAWVKQYRTLNDNGDRLYFDAHQKTTGVIGTDNKAYLADGSLAKDNLGNQLYIGTKIYNTTLYNVCVPTHIVWHLGANGGATFEQLDKIINTAKKDFPNVIIALGMNDCMGTIFPTAYGVDAYQCRWCLLDGDNYLSRHLNVYAIQQLFDEKFDNQEQRDKGVYVLPFFFVSNPTHFSVRESNYPEFDYSNTTPRHLQTFGWFPSVHADIRAHSNYAYQMYAWLKYTLTKE